MDNQVKTSEYTTVNKNFLSQEGRTAAQNFGSLPKRPPLTGVTADQVIANTEAKIGSNPINASDLADVRPMTLRDPSPLTAPDGLAGEIVSGAASFKENAAKNTEQKNKVQELQTKAETSKKTFLEKFLGSKGEQEKTDAAYSQTVDPVEQELTNINQEIFNEEERLRREIEALDKQPGTIEQKEQKAYDLKKESSKYQADLYVKQLGIQGRYDSAKRIADRKIAVELEKDKRDLELLKFDYEDNKELFSKEEQRLFEREQADRERELNAKEAKLKQFEDTRLALLKSANEQNAPLDVKTAIANAKTAEEAIQAAGQYAGDILERKKKLLEIDKLNKEIQALGVPTITNPQAGQYAGALNIILGSSSSLSKDQKNTIINAVNNGQDPFSVIKNQAKNIMGQTNATKLDNYETAKQQLLDVQTALEQYYAAGGDTSLLKGNYEKVINKLGEVKDPNLVQISTQIQSALQIYRNAVSGTAYSVQEGADIASIFPGINKSEGLNKAVLTGRMNAFDSTIDATYKNVLGDTYTTLKKAETAQQVQDVGVPKVIPQTQVPEGYYQASDGKFYKK